MNISRNNPQTASQVLSSMTASDVEVRPINENDLASLGDALDLPANTDESMDAHAAASELEEATRVQAAIDAIAGEATPPARTLKHRRIHVTAQIFAFRSWGRFTGDDGRTRPSGAYITMRKSDGELVIGLIPFQARMYDDKGVEVGMNKILQTVNNPHGFKVVENVGRTFKFEGFWTRNEATYGASGKKLSRDEFFITSISKA